MTTETTIQALRDKAEAVRVVDRSPAYCDQCCRETVLADHGGGVEAYVCPDRSCSGRVCPYCGDPDRTECGCMPF
jgi:hypothetical protein